ncbi:hypothetical protein [Brochothrix thermosphacta]|uniref:hypothetical protein n=1 Tax=Brochothrix thermosphacta TaxID=2756 RepID=UPI000D7A6957|nr:hypothetical protein [Brochothrix thermosphacta]SPN75227.1 conserved hypothetical protein [Brochothrix thermosphacta]
MTIENKQLETDLLIKDLVKKNVGHLPQEAIEEKKELQNELNSFASSKIEIADKKLIENPSMSVENLAIELVKNDLKAVNRFSFKKIKKGE